MNPTVAASNIGTIRLSAIFDALYSSSELFKIFSVSLCGPDSSQYQHFSATLSHGRIEKLASGHAPPAGQCGGENPHDCRSPNNAHSRRTSGLKRLKIGSAYAVIGDAAGAATISPYALFGSDRP